MNNTIIKHTMAMDSLHITGPNECDFYYSPSHDRYYKKCQQVKDGVTYISYKICFPEYTITSYMNELEHEEAVRQDYEKLTEIDDDVIAEYLKQRLDKKVEVYEKEN